MAVQCTLQWTEGQADRLDDVEHFGSKRDQELLPGNQRLNHMGDVKFGPWLG